MLLVENLDKERVFPGCKDPHEWPEQAESWVRPSATPTPTSFNIVFITKYACLEYLSSLF